MTMRAALPEFFKGWNPFRPELQAVLKTGYQSSANAELCCMINFIVNLIGLEH